MLLQPILQKNKNKNRLFYGQVFCQIAYRIKKQYSQSKGRGDKIKIFQTLTQVEKKNYIRTNNGQCFSLPNFWIGLYLDKNLYFF